MKKVTAADCLTKFKERHGDRYIYYPEEYVEMSKPTRIGCKIHGDFTQVATRHARGQGCPMCAIALRTGPLKISFAEMVGRAREKHGDDYEYHEETYRGANHKTRVTCKVHGDFYKIAGSLMRGSRCYQCSRTRKKFSDFVAEATETHNGRYTYHEDSFTKSEAQTRITCPIHGDFWQKAANHSQGKGCKVCADNTLPFSEFLRKVRLIFGDKYEYDEGSYVRSNMREHMKVTCREHGVFGSTPTNLLQGHGCPKCGHGRTSKWEQEIQDFLAPYAPENNYRLKLEGDQIRKPRYDLVTYTELDIYLPKQNLAIEANGLYWHNENSVGEHFHSDKLKACNARGIDLIQIYEDEWQTKRPIVESIILTRLGKFERRIPARKTMKTVASKDQAREFYGANHIQGYVNADTHVALTFEGEIVAMASFGVRKQLFNSETPELIRFCTLLNTQVVGGLSKLTKNWSELRTYCDLRLFNGSGYKAAGFKEVSISKPGYYYVKKGVRYSRFAFQKHKLEAKLPIYDPTLTEGENMAMNGYTRIYNCGNKVLERWAIRI